MILKLSWGYVMIIIIGYVSLKFLLNFTEFLKGLPENVYSHLNCKLLAVVNPNFPLGIDQFRISLKRADIFHVLTPLRCCKMFI